MNSRHRKTLKVIFSHPVFENISFADIEALLVAVGAILSEARGFALITGVSLSTSIGHIRERKHYTIALRMRGNFLIV